ncbi:hypothetical protein [Fusobacterium vincentii]|uniref:hypothetical protein n=1 Tax=Fusobacterium vincentii TaxID=155615 RepID=UPI0030CE63BE
MVQKTFKVMVKELNTTETIHQRPVIARIVNYLEEHGEDTEDLLFLSNLKKLLKHYQNFKANETGYIELEEDEYECYLKFLERGL